MIVTLLCLGTAILLLVLFGKGIVAFLQQPCGCLFGMLLIILGVMVLLLLMSSGTLSVPWTV